LTTRMKTAVWILVAVIVVIVVVGLARMPSSQERREKAEREALRACRDETDPAKRIAEYEQFLGKFPEGNYRGYAFYYIFNTYLDDLADTVKALSYARGVLSSAEPVDSRAQLYPALMSFWKETGAADSVVAVAREALDSSATDCSIYNEMGYELAEAGMHLDLAVELCERATQLAKEDYEKSYCYDSLGWAYLKAGDSERAVEALEQAVKFAGEGVDETVLMHLGEAQKAAGRAEAAIETYLKVMVFGEYDEARAVLEGLYVKVKGSAETLTADIKALRQQAMTPAQDFTLASTANQTMSLSDFKGQVVLLNFMSPT
jgi:tetratricopeptide (TPR) repeat protein